MSAPWTVRVWRHEFTEPVSALAWSDAEAREYLASVAQDHGPGVLVQLVDPDGEVAVSEVAS